MNMFVQSQFCLSRLKSLALGSQDDGSCARVPYDDARQAAESLDLIGAERRVSGRVAGVHGHDLTRAGDAEPQPVGRCRYHIPVPVRDLYVHEDNVFR